MMLGKTKFNEQGLQEKLATGYQIEDPDEMSPRYRDVLVNTIHIAATCASYV